MNEYENAFVEILDDDFIKWLAEFYKSLTPNQRAALKELLSAYFEYLIARCKDSEPTEPLQSEGE